VEKPPRKTRTRTPKVDKITKPKAGSAAAEAAAEAAEPVANGDVVVKPKGAPRKRKKPVKDEAKDASAATVGGPAAAADGEEVDPVTAIIEAVLARAVASAASDSEESPKKPRKKAAKKQGQDGGAAAKVPKLDGEEKGEHDADDSSTAGDAASY